MGDPKVDHTTVATTHQSQTIGFHHDYMTSIARHAALKLCLPPPGDPPAFKIAYWDESGDLGISARYLTVAGGIKRRRIQTEDASEEDVVDVTSLQKTKPLPSLRRASSQAPFPKQYDDSNEDLCAPLEDYEESELALESWMGEVRGRIETSPPLRGTEDDVWSENFGPARISRDLQWFYRDRLSRHDAAVTLPSYRSPSHRAILKSELNAQPIPPAFAHEISAKARLDVSLGPTYQHQTPLCGYWLQKTSPRGTAQVPGEATMSQTPQTVRPGASEHPPALGYQRPLSGKPHRASSQSTRIDQNGSAMPSVRALNQRVADTQGYPKEGVPVDQYLRTEFHTEDEQGVSYAKGVDLMNDPMLPLNPIPPPQQWHTSRASRGYPVIARNLATFQIG